MSGTSVPIIYEPADRIAAPIALVSESTERRRCNTPEPGPPRHEEVATACGEL